ncbi:MAG: ArsR family transcriptional regulator [Candidatus Thermoplasmatota archaeon]|nr:ArsR family transcriptional regulator [Candidatus Thermoplasmatota archaeon]
MMLERIFRRRSIQIMDELIRGPLSLSELSDRIKISKPALQQEYLKDLEEMGIIKKVVQRNIKGRQVNYHLQPFTFHFSLHPSSGTCLDLVSRKELFDVPLFLHQVPQDDIKDEIAELLDEMERTAPKVKPTYAILFGSAAKGTASVKSDIDMVFLKRSWPSKHRECFMDLLAKASLMTQHRMSPILMTEEEFEKGASPIIEEIKENGVVVYDGGEKEGRIWCLLKRYRNISL